MKIKNMNYSFDYTIVYGKGHQPRKLNIVRFSNLGIIISFLVEVSGHTSYIQKLKCVA